MGSKIAQLSTNVVMVFMVSANNRSVGVSGATLSCSISRAGGAFISINPPVTDRGLGWYAVTLSPVDCSLAGQLVLHVEASACDNSDVVFDVVSSGGQLKLLA
jgi:hypothetical protein